jgi:anaerobic magnesium-protoporphyrin IX monomethyl ester cyclase
MEKGKMRILYLPNEYSQQRQREKKRKIYPILMAMEAEWYREQGEHYVDFDPDERFSYPNGFFDKIITEPEGLDFLSLPKPDRVFTRAMDKKYQSNGNFKYTPGTYIQSASGCWWGKCSFCVEKDKPYIVRSVNDVLQEINECQALGFREVFDDSATFPTGKWLEEFCQWRKGIIFPKISCNMRLVDVDYKMMKDAGFRMLLFGVESANQETLDRINKGVKVEDIKYIKKASEAGLEPHIAVMFGYPWESDEDALKTLRLVHWLLRNGYAKTAQASFYRPNKTGDRQGDSKLSHRHFTKRIYNVAYSPQFWFNKIKDVHNIDDLKYLWRMIKEGLNAKRFYKNDIRK